MPELATASAITFQLGTRTTVTIAPTAETVTVGQVFNPLYGIRISDPLALSGLPVEASRTTWTVTPGAPGSTCTVETSIDNQLTWDAAINGGEIPRLKRGDTTTRNVYTRVTMTRPLATDTSPQLTSLDVRVATDASTFELIPVAHGIVDKVTTTVASTDTGSSGGSGGSGVTGKGGGRTGGGTNLKVHGMDLSKAVARNPWSAPKVIPAGTNIGDAALDIVLDRLPTFDTTQVNIASVDHETTEPFIYGLSGPSDPWQDDTELCTAAGCEVFFGPDGVFTFRQVPNPAVMAPVWTIDDDAHPVITTLVRELADEETFNYVVVKSEGTSTTNPLSATAFDNDPTSPTYIFGDYGTKAVVVTLQNIQTQDQAQTAANAILQGSLGGAETVTITMVPNPCLEPGDLVIVDVEDAKASGVYLISGIPTLPLSPTDAMQIICYRQTR